MQGSLGNQVQDIFPPGKSDRIEEEPSTPTNHETNFFKFLKKDFEDLSLGPIKRPKHKKTGKWDDMYQTSSEQASKEQPEDGAPVDQEAAAAAWRAARAEKSCLHSGKAGSGKSGKPGAEEDLTGSKWTQLETTWRVSTLPFRKVPDVLMDNFLSLLSPLRCATLCARSSI